jgi:hypothetical protein
MARKKAEEDKAKVAAEEAARKKAEEDARRKPEPVRPAAGDADKSNAARKLVSQLAGAIQEYERETKKLPGAGNAGLVAALQSKQKDGKSEYYAFSRETLVNGAAIDPWGRPLVYRPAEKGKGKRGKTFEVYSMGPNGKDDGGEGDDIAP